MRCRNRRRRAISNFYKSIEVGTAPFATGVRMMALSEAIEARDMANKRVVVLPGDYAAPESMNATMDALGALELPD